MRTWPSPEVPVLSTPGPPVRIFDTTTGALSTTQPDGAARLYVCGITPYDATHLGHAATYVAFDLLNRAWRNAGYDVEYAQNITDVDDPLLERAARDGVDWADLAEREIELFRQDMTALRVLAPRYYDGVVESIPLVIQQIQELADRGATYDVDGDLYYSVSADRDFGKVSGMLRDEMLHVFPKRGGDPERPGKRDPLDPLLWRAERPGEPAWDSPFGRGRPGWHIECSAIALARLGSRFDVQGGGVDLVFPHHEMSAAHAQAAHHGVAFARAYVHAGMVAYQGEKMSKSLGNLVLVSTLRQQGADPMAIRLVLLAQHYREDWEYRPEQLVEATQRAQRWQAALDRPAGAPTGGPQGPVEVVLAALADDLRAPTAVAAVDEWVAATLAGDDSEPTAVTTMRDLLDAALGVAW